MRLDHYYLQFALHLAMQNEGITGINPSVGAVVVRDGKVVSWANHPGAGQPHAEILAMQSAAEQARGATLYCTLEPCAHTGRTPPCTGAIISAGMARVVFAAKDNNPLVSGNGESILRSSGIQTDHVPVRSIEEFYRSFFHIFRRQRPYFVAKAAMTANGVISPADRNSRWITNEISRKWVHHLRARCDAILVGADTVQTDRPALTVRLAKENRTPTRIVLDRSLKVDPEQCSLFQSTGPIVVCASETASKMREDAWIRRGVRVVRFKDAFSLSLDLLGLGLRKILIEGGQKTFTFFHTAGLVDEYILMIAPVLLTGQQSISLLIGPEQTLDSASRYEVGSSFELNGDVVIRMSSRKDKAS